MNRSHEMAPFADALVAMDYAWWAANGGNIARPMEYWTTNEEAADVFGLNYVEGEAGGGVSRRPDVARHGSNSGFLALSLAILFGAERVVLLGYDMQFTGGRKHWHADHGGNLHNPEACNFAGWISRFATLSGSVEIVNASRETALDCFPRMALEEALA